MATKAEKPTVSDKITINVDGTDREIFMSFGLLNHLTSIVADPARVAAIPIVPEIRNEVLKAVLAIRKKSGKIETPVADIDDIDISIQDVERILDWIAEHVMSFFVRSLNKVVATTKEHQQDLTALASFLGGSSASASETPSSGPSK